MFVLQRRRLAAEAPGKAGGDVDSVEAAGSAAAAAASVNRRTRHLLAASAGSSGALPDRTSKALQGAASRSLQGAAPGSDSGSGSGNDPFIAGLRRYLAAHKFGSATTSDLWSALADASGDSAGRGHHLQQRMNRCRA